jgi:hypothetical protein
MTTGSGDIPAAAANILIIIGTSTAIMALAPLFGVTAMHIASTKQLLAHAAIIIAMLLLSQLGGSDAASTAFAGSEGAATRSLNSGVWIDTGYTKSVFNNPKKLINVRPTQGTYVVQGVAGQVRASGQGDFPLSLRDNLGIDTSVWSRVASSQTRAWQTCWLHKTCERQASDSTFQATLKHQ